MHVPQHQTKESTLIVLYNLNVGIFEASNVSRDVYCKPTVYVCVWRRWEKLNTGPSQNTQQIMYLYKRTSWILQVKRFYSGSSIVN